MFAIERLNSVELQPLHLPRESRITNVFDFGLVRRNTGVPQRRSLIKGGQKRRTPIVDSPVRQSRANSDERRQVGVFGSQPISDPRPDTRANKIVAAGMYLKNCSAVRRVSSVQRMHKTNVVNVRRQFRKQVADTDSRLAELPKLPRRFEQITRRRKLHARLGERQRRVGWRC